MDGQVDCGEFAVGFDSEARMAHGFFAQRGFVQGCGQVVPQSLAGHLQDVADAGLTRGRLQIHPGAAVQVEDVAVLVYKRAG